MKTLGVEGLGFRVLRCAKERHEVQVTCAPSIQLHSFFLSNSLGLKVHGLRFTGDFHLVQYEIKVPWSPTANISLDPQSTDGVLLHESPERPKDSKSCIAKQAKQRYVHIYAYMSVSKTCKD